MWLCTGQIRLFCSSGLPPSLRTVAATIHDAITAQHRLKPAAPALSDGHVSLSFQQLEADSNRLARALLDMGLEECARCPVGLSLGGYRSVVAVLGVFKTGNPYLPLDPDYPLDRIKYMIADSGITVVLTISDHCRQGPFAGVCLSCLCPNFCPFSSPSPCLPIRLLHRCPLD